MAPEALLLAETDPRMLINLPRALSEPLPHVRIDVCTSTEGLTHRLRQHSYDAGAISPLFIHDYRLVKQKQPLQLLAPLLVTASREQCSLAKEALHTNAFDLIVKPIVPTEAAHTVRLALWQNRLLRLLTTKDQAVSRFREHMAAFPYARQAEAHFTSKMAAFDRTFHALQSSIRLLLNVDDDQSLFDIAASVENLARERALERLVILCKDNTIH